MLNYFTPLEFKVVINRIPTTLFNIQTVQIPGVSTNSSTAETQNVFGRLTNTSEKLNYQDLELTFIIDEKMKNYFEILDWIKGTVFPDNFGQYRKLKESPNGIISDISIVVVGSSKNANIEFTYKNCFPIGLSGILLDTTSQDLQYSTATVTFTYDTFDYKLLAT